jgi:hypothetical protein
MELYPSAYPGFVSGTLSQNWQGYDFLSIDVYNPQKKEVSVTVRLDDRKKAPDYSDRYNKRFVLKPGDNRILIPKASIRTSITERKLDLTQIRRIYIFMSHPKTRHVLYLDNIRLYHTVKTQF